MKRIIALELKQIFKNKMFLLFCFLGIIVSGFFSHSFLGVQESITSEKNENGEYIYLHGKEAIEDLKNISKDIPVLLTDDVLQNDLEKLRSIYKKDGGNYSTNFELESKPYSYLNSLTGVAFKPNVNSTEKRYDIENLTDDDIRSFYETRELNLKSWSDENYTSDVQKEKFMDMENKVSKPFTYYFATGWDLIMWNITVIIVLLAVIVTFLSSSTFPNIYISGEDSVTRVTMFSNKK